ncbi:MAG: hypothetical protein WDA59_01090 [Methanofastidiosum sp.]
MYNRAYIATPEHERVLVYLMTDNHKQKRQGNNIAITYINLIREGYTHFALDQKYLDTAIAEASKDKVTIKD